MFEKQWFFLDKAVGHLYSTTFEIVPGGQLQPVKPKDEASAASGKYFLLFFSAGKDINSEVNIGNAESCLKKESLESTKCKTCTLIHTVLHCYTFSYRHEGGGHRQSKHRGRRQVAEADPG